MQFRALFGAVLHVNGAETTKQQVQGLFPIHIAAELLLPDAVLYLLRWGVDVNRQALSSKRTALHYAARFSQQDEKKRRQQRAILQVLIAYKAHHNVPDSRGHVPLFNAIMTEDMNIIKLLTAADDVPINHADIDGDTHLHIAADINSDEIVRFLVEKGANPLLSNHDGETPSHTAAKKSWACLTAMNEACTARGLDIVKTFGQEDTSGHTPLDYAAIHKHRDSFQYMWECIQRNPSRSATTYKPVLDRLYGERTEDIQFVALQHTLEILPKPL